MTERSPEDRRRLRAIASNAAADYDARGRDGKVSLYFHHASPMARGLAAAHENPLSVAASADLAIGPKAAEVWRSITGPIDGFRGGALPGFGQREEAWLAECLASGRVPFIVEYADGSWVVLATDLPEAEPPPIHTMPGA